MAKLVPIVEGDGEVEAVPVLLRRLSSEVCGFHDLEILRPKNAHGCGGLTKPGGVERFVQFVATRKE